MRLETSPYRKAASATAMWGNYFRGIFPRRRRVLVYALICIAVFWTLSRLGLSGFGRTLVFFLFSPEWAGPYSGGRGRAGGPGVDVLQFIDPLIGTTNGGHVFAGATLPYGMAKPVADTQSPAENAAGFVSDDNPVLGFSHMHDSGTGGLPSMGNFPLFVHPGCPDDDFAKCSFSVHHRPLRRVPGSVSASVGYFSINLTNSVRAEMTATEHTALYRFSFPGTDTIRTADDGDVPLGQPNPFVPYSPLILLDLIDLANTRSRGGIQVYEDGRIVGEGQYAPSFGSGRYQAFFCADFRGAKIRKTGTFVTNDAKEEPKFLTNVDGDTYLPSGSVGAWIQFERPPTDSVLARMGLSFISPDQACENAEREVPDFDFQMVEKKAQGVWRDKLSSVQVDPTGVSEELQTTFWSGLYRTMLSPQNYTGENQLWNSSEPYFDSFYCIWDSFRAQHPLLSIIDPRAQIDMVRGMIDIYRFEGKLPDCRMSFCQGYSQGGSNADVVVADAFVKGLRRGINWTTAYEAVVSDAEVEPANWGLHGRGNLVSWHALGYIPHGDVDNNGTGPMSRTVSRGVEYAYDDFCISLLARSLGRPADEVAKYAARGANWRNYWNPGQADTFLENANSQQVITQSPFVGFVQPRRPDGTFYFQNTRTCSPVQNMHSCYYDTGLDTYEGSPWLYSFFAPQDMASLITLMGGPEQFVARLSYFHSASSGPMSYLGNEQGFLPTFQFHYAGRPALSSYWAHRYIPAQFNASVNGIPGNDDCAMGAFSGFVLMGFFPVAGQDVYLLIPPFFREVRLKARGWWWGETGGPGGGGEGKGEKGEKWAVIRTKNFDGRFLRDSSSSSSSKARRRGEGEEGGEDEKEEQDPEASGGKGRKGRGKIYIQRAWLNGRPYRKNWITHDFFVKGGLLELEVGDEESDWGTRPDEVPPSYPVSPGKGNGV